MRENHTISTGILRNNQRVCPKFATFSLQDAYRVKPALSTCLV